MSSSTPWSGGPARAIHPADSRYETESPEIHFYIFFQFGDGLHEANFDVGFVTPVNPVTISWMVSESQFIFQDGSEFFSTIHVESVVATSFPDVYKSESTSIELDITVPPWSGDEEIDITFRPVPLTHGDSVHHWRICR